jgi:hypothetical protein
MAAAILAQDVQLQDWLNEVFHIRLYKTRWNAPESLEYIYSPNWAPKYNPWMGIDDNVKAVNAAMTRRPSTEARVEG